MEEDRVWESGEGGSEEDSFPEGDEEGEAESNGGSIGVGRFGALALVEATESTEEEE